MSEATPGRADEGAKKADRPLIRVGLIGYGLAGEVFHAPLIAAEPAMRLSMIATSRTEAAARTGARVAPSPEALLEDPDVDLVVIAAPNERHAPLAERALEAGKHVVVEKPFTVTTADADRLCGLARRRGLVLTVFQNRRFDGDFLTVRELAASGRLGKLYAFESRFDRFRPEPRARWKEQAVPGGGTLYDLGAHLIDQAILLFGMPESIVADVSTQRPGAEAPDYFHLILRYGAVRVVLRSGSVVSDPWPRFRLDGDRGSFVKTGLDPQEEQLKAGVRPGDPGWGSEAPARYGELSGGERIPTRPGCYERFYRELALSIGARDPAQDPPVSAASAADVIRVIEAALASEAEGRRVALR
jgi:scyllo-inositol 2-dehydrogenase (NADP+)